MFPNVSLHIGTYSALKLYYWSAVSESYLSFAASLQFGAQVIVLASDTSHVAGRMALPKEQP